MEVLKPVIFNRGSKRLFLRFKKTPENTFLMNGLSGKTTTLNK